MSRPTWFLIASLIVATILMTGPAPAHAGSSEPVLGATFGRVVQGPPLAALVEDPGEEQQAWSRHRLQAGALAMSSAPAEIVGPDRIAALAPTDPTTFRTTAVTGAPRSFTSEVDEPSVATDGTTVLFTYNWYAALSVDGGATFRYLSPFSNFPTSGSTFCCDQRALYVPSRNLFVWLLQYGGTDPGFERLAVATPVNAALNKWTTWEFRARDFTGVDPTFMVDYAQIAASSNYLYLTMSYGAIGSTGPSGTGIFRIPLDQLAQGTRPLTFSQSTSARGNAITPVQQATATMYFGQNVSSTTVNLFVWPENGTVSTVEVTHASTPSARGVTCTAPGGRNVCGRIDSRVQTGWLGAGVIGFAWTAGTGGADAHVYPYVQTIRIDEATRAVVDAPTITSSVAAYIYPAASLNARGDLAVVATTVSPQRSPSTVAFLRDDVSGPTQWTTLTLKNGTGSPSADEWGDYQTVIRATPTANSWIAATYTIQATGVEPAFISFGRVRDDPSTTQSPPSPTPSPSPSPTPAPAPGANQPTTVYLPNVTKMLGGPDGWQTPFIVQNVGSVRTDLTMSFYAFADGSLVKTRTVAALAPGTSVFHDPNSDTELPPGGQFSVVVRSTSSAIVAVVNEHQNVQNTARQEALSYSGLSSGSTAVALPYVAKQASGWLTTFIMQNLGTATANVSARFVSGVTTVTLTRTIAPGRSGFIDPTVESQLANGSEYAATLTSDQPIAVVVNAHNDAASAQFPRGFSYNGMPAASRTFHYLPYVARNADGRNSRLVVQNAGLVQATPRLFLRKLDAATSTSIDLPQLPPGAAASFDVATATQLTDGEYSLEATGGQLAIVNATTSTTTAMGYVGQSAYTETIYLPNITRTLGGVNGWTTPFLVQQWSSYLSPITIKWYRFADGTLAFTQTLSGLAFAVSHRVDPRQIPQLNDDSQYAVVISAPLGAFAVVTELNLSGGDGAMGYEGFAPPAPASSTSFCTPTTGMAGTFFSCRIIGLPAGAAATLTLGSSAGSSAPIPTVPTAADGTWNETLNLQIEGQRTITITAAGVARSAQVTVTPATFTVVISQVQNGLVSATTSPGLVCRAVATLSDGSLSTAAALQSTQTADVSGNVKWTYPADTKPLGRATMTVLCASGDLVISDARTYNIP